MFASPIVSKQGSFITETNKDNCFEQKSLAWGFVSISNCCPAGVSLNTSNRDRGEKMICTTPDLAI